MIHESDLSSAGKTPLLGGTATRRVLEEEGIAPRGFDEKAFRAFLEFLECRTEAQPEILES